MVDPGAVEYGEVKDFYITHGYGFMYALDSDGLRTGEELIFYFDEGEFIRWHGDTPEFIGRTKVVCDKIIELHRPWRTQRLVILRTRRFGRDDYRAYRWGYANQGDESAEQPDEQIQWQIASYLSEGDDRKETLLSILLSGVRSGTYEGVTLWSARELGFTAALLQAHRAETVVLDVPDPDRHIIFWLEVFENNEWRKRIAITPAKPDPG